MLWSGSVRIYLSEVAPHRRRRLRLCGWRATGCRSTRRRRSGPPLRSSCGWTRRRRGGARRSCVSSEMRGFSAVYGAGSGVAWKDAVMGRAPASNCVMGRSPSRNSMVRSIDVVLYMVLSTVCRLMYGEIRNAGRAVRIDMVRSVLRVVLQDADQRCWSRSATSTRLRRSCPARNRYRPPAESGAIRPAVVPEVWSLPSRIDNQPRHRCRSSRIRRARSRKTLARSTSG